MRIATGSITLALLAAAWVPGARAQVLDPILDSLRPGADFTYGCFSPCACPVVGSGAMTGTFTLDRTSVDPLYEHYALLGIHWKAPLPDGSGGTRDVVLTGSGTWDVGGEVAVTQHLVLTLSVDGGPPQSFDSGVIAGPAQPPRIDAIVRAHAGAGVDTVIHVVAGPPGTAGVPAAAEPRLLLAPAPNPARGAVAFGVAMPRSGLLRVDVLDVRGRAIATPFDGWLAAGESRLHWDGRDARGEDAGAGVFWLRARAAGRQDARRIERVR